MDVVIGTSPQFFTAVAAKMIALIRRRPWIMEVRDLWPESIVAVGAMKKSSSAYKILHRIEKHLYRSATLIVVVTESFKNYIIDLGVTQEKIKVIKNGVDTSMFVPQPKNKNLISEFSLNLQG